MYCPKCSQPIAAQQIQFCSRCGISLAGLNELVASAGETQKADLRTSAVSSSKVQVSSSEETEDGKQNAESRRRKGIKQGAALMLLSVILIPAYFLLAALFPPNDRLVESAVSDTPFEKISQAILLTMFLLGFVRVGYAWFFQKEQSPELQSATSPAELPPAQTIPVTGFGAWRAASGELVDRRPEA